MGAAADFGRRYFQEVRIGFRPPEVKAVVLREIHILEEVLDAIVVLLVGQALYCVEHTME